MNRSIFRRNEHPLRAQGETFFLNRNMASLSFGAYDGNELRTRHLSSVSNSSADHILTTHRSYSVDIEEREDCEIPVLREISTSRRDIEIPTREMAADSRDPEEEEDLQYSLRADSEECKDTATTTRQSQDIFSSRSTPRDDIESRDETFDASPSNMLGAVSGLKRANPIYESDNEFEGFEDSYPDLMRKRRCSTEHIITEVYWQQRFNTRDE